MGQYGRSPLSKCTVLIKEPAFADILACIHNLSTFLGGAPIKKANRLHFVSRCESHTHRDIIKLIAELC